MRILETSINQYGIEGAWAEEGILKVEFSHGDMKELEDILERTDNDWADSLLEHIQELFKTIEKRKEQFGSSSNLNNTKEKNT